ncbi:hypothetical protein OJE16_04410 [Pantoea tagorei]
MATAEIVSVPGEMIPVAIVMAVAVRIASEAIAVRAAVRAVTVRATIAIVVTVAIVTVAVMLLPGLAVVVARAISPGNRGNQ